MIEISITNRIPYGPAVGFTMLPSDEAVEYNEFILHLLIVDFMVRWL